MTELEERLNRLEIKASHQEAQINDLSEMVSDQWKLIERLGGMLKKADARIESLENNTPDSAPDLLDEKPPHY
jgi:SlyX protein|tara:strand:- start:160599 stop:160817 length:219 start_codon:yes stop_codon:yes gene_type:complete